MNTRTYILSSTTLSHGVSGDPVFDTGATNFILSFSGVNVTGKYLKFLVEYSDNPGNITVVQPSTNLYNVKDETLSRIFLPSDKYLTSYYISASGIKNDLQIDRYKVHVNIGKTTLNQYNDVKIIDSYLYTNNEGSNYLLLSMEAQQPRYFGNLVVPFNKSRSVYLPGPITPFGASDNVILRAEIWTYFGSASGGAYMPVVTEKKLHEIITEDQYEIRTFGPELNSHGRINGVHFMDDFNFALSLYSDHSKEQIDEEPYRPDAPTDHEIHLGYLIPEDGIDYLSNSVEDPENFDKAYVPSTTIKEIYPGGLMP